MKRVITTSVAAGLLGALAYAPVASAQDAALYGNLRYGVQMDDDGMKDSKNVWNLAANKASRWGVKGSMPAGEGLTAGFHFERNLGDMSARHHNVSLSGDFGTFKFGRQSSPYYGATTWDGTQAFGGLTDPFSRSSGISFASNLEGPFSFSALVGSGDAGADGTSDGANHIEVAASLAAGPVNVSVGYYDNDTDMNEKDRIGGTAGGQLAGFNWEVGFDAGTDTCGAKCDDERVGFHLGYTIGDGNLYTNYSDTDSDSMDYEKSYMADKSRWVFGYSHVVAKNVVVYAETAMTDKTHETAGDITSTSTAVALKVGF